MATTNILIVDKDRPGREYMAENLTGRGLSIDSVDDARDAPGIAHIAFQTAALTLAHEGVKVMRGA